ncbi:MAG: hypothetical protein OXI30_08315, partial [Chloroflexota bacterium]|nr:hypothetical protein [Chloroflexota bacterium]
YARPYRLSGGCNLPISTEMDTLPPLTENYHSGVSARRLFALLPSECSASVFSLLIPFRMDCIGLAMRYSLGMSCSENLSQWQIGCK